MVERKLLLYAESENLLPTIKHALLQLRWRGSGKNMFASIVSMNRLFADADQVPKVV